MKRGLVMAGGGTMGSYEAGVVRYFVEHNLHFDVVTGTSIGALNGCIMAQQQEERLIDLWDKIQMDYVIAGKLPTKFEMTDLLTDANLITSFFSKYMKEKGADITPLKILINEYFDYDALVASPIEYGLVTVQFPSLKPTLITKKDMTSLGREYLLASASCFPAFPICTIENNQYVDGGYFDNCPVDFNLSLGAEELTIIDLGVTPLHPIYTDRPMMRYIHPYVDLGGFLNFDRSILDRNIKVGYLDARKAYGEIDGFRYKVEAFQTDPAYFVQFYQEVLRFEMKARESMIFKDDALVTHRLATYISKGSLSIRDMGLAMMDQILNLLDIDETKVYEVKEIRAFVRDAFKPYADPDFNVLPNKATEVLGFLMGLDTKDKVGRIAHQYLYPNQEGAVSDKVLLNTFSWEAAMALFVKSFMEDPAVCQE